MKTVTRDVETGAIYFELGDHEIAITQDQAKELFVELAKCFAVILDNNQAHWLLHQVKTCFAVPENELDWAVELLKHHSAVVPK